MRKILKKILVLTISVVMCLLMSISVYAYNSLDDDGKRDNQNETSMNIIYATTGMLRINDEGTSVKVNKDQTITVNATTASSKTWGKITKLAFIEQTASDAEKDEAARKITFSDASFSTSEVSRKISFTIPVSDAGRMIPVCRFVSSSDTEGSWTNFSAQQYFIVLLTDTLKADIENLKKAKAVEELLNKLPGASSDVSNKTGIEEARKAYDALTKEQKEFVDSAALKKLTDSEAALKNAETKKPAQINIVAVGTVIKEGTISYKVSKDNEVVLQKNGNKKAKKVSIPATISYQGQSFKVTAIADKAFAGSKKLTNVTIGENITTIGKQAFKGDKNLKKIIFKGKLVKKVGKKAFSGISKKAIFKAPKKVLKKYRKMMKKAGAPKTAKYKK